MRKRVEQVRVARQQASEIIKDKLAEKGQTLLEGEMDSTLLVVSELVTNSVKYADRGGPNSETKVTLISAPDLIIVEVVDPGSMWDGPKLASSPHLMEDGGRGLILVGLFCEGRWGTRLLPDDRCLTWAAVARGHDAPGATEVIKARRSPLVA